MYHIFADGSSTSPADWRILLAVAVLAVWVVGWLRIRTNYRRVDRLIRWCWLGIGIAVLGCLFAAGSGDPPLLVPPAILAVAAGPSLAKSMANQRLARRMQRVGPATPSTSKVQPPVDPPATPARFIERTLWSVQFANRAELRAQAGTLFVEFVRSLLAARGNIRSAVAAAKPNPPENVDRSAPEGAGTLFLWVFETEPERDLIDTLRRAGPVAFLRGGGVLADGHIIATLRGREDAVIEATTAEVDARLTEFDAERQRGATGIPPRWPEQTMLCSDDTWTAALDGLLRRSQRVVMDLTLFGAGRRGCEFELAALVDRVPTNQVIFVTGRRTNIRLLKQTLADAWVRMAADSPNRTGSPEPFLLLRARYLRSTLRSKSAQEQGLRSPREVEIGTFARLIGLVDEPPATRSR